MYGKAAKSSPSHWSAHRSRVEGPRAPGIQIYIFPEIYPIPIVIVKDNEQIFIFSCTSRKVDDRRQGVPTPAVRYRQGPAPGRHRCRPGPVRQYRPTAWVFHGPIPGSAGIRGRFLQGGVVSSGFWVRGSGLGLKMNSSDEIARPLFQRKNNQNLQCQIICPVSMVSGHGFGQASAN